MFKFIKDSLNDDDKKIFDVTLRPFIVWSAVMIVYIALTSCIGKDLLNVDVFRGMLISWVIYAIILMITMAIRDSENV